MAYRLRIYNIPCFYITAFVIVSEYLKVSFALRKWERKETSDDAVLDTSALHCEYCDPWSEWSVCNGNNEQFRLRWCVFKRTNAPVMNPNNPMGVPREPLERLQFIEHRPRRHSSPDAAVELSLKHANCTDSLLPLDVCGQKQSATGPVPPFNSTNIGQQRTDVRNDQDTYKDSDVSPKVGHARLETEHKMLQEKSAFNLQQPRCQLELNKMGSDIYTRRELAKTERQEAILRREVTLKRYGDLCAGVLSALDPHILSQIEEDKRRAKVEYDRADNALKQQILNAKVEDERAMANISVNNTPGNAIVDKLRSDIYKQRQYFREEREKLEYNRGVALKRYDDLCAGVLSALDPHILSQIEEDKRRAKVEYDRADNALKQQILNAKVEDERAMTVFNAESRRCAMELGLGHNVKDTSQRDIRVEARLNNNVQKIEEQIDDADTLRPEKRKAVEEGTYDTPNSDNKPHNNTMEGAYSSKKQDQDVSGDLHATSNLAKSEELLVNDGPTKTDTDKFSHDPAKQHPTGPTSVYQRNTVDIYERDDAVHESADESGTLSDGTSNTSKTVMNADLWKTPASVTEKRRIKSTSTDNSAASKNDTQGVPKHGNNSEAQVLAGIAKKVAHFDGPKQRRLVESKKDGNRYIMDLAHDTIITNGKRIGTSQPLHSKWHQRPLIEHAQTGLGASLKENTSIRSPQASANVKSVMSHRSPNHTISQHSKGLTEGKTLPLDTDERKHSDNPYNGGTDSVVLKITPSSTGNADKDINVQTMLAPATAEKFIPKRIYRQTVKMAGAGIAVLLILTAGSAVYIKKKR
ncbi:hypothetical protein BBBOND_0205480 [Babesia bigemina]|uniref:Uncharacterized protein n=1 Tax=Babesia bigemina TaxID=5866 RepID=A0A061DC81_BABBI|nr:hypothetical protein BBBOND_0205480 [Babesia bigemina]CDR95390.1 hypothetical protein BBBOND_0205480 [Babesia bigemina]|eukprot:XP_012767576.1 hypothetical protein BBBOND_0205480 [Babesia bigemina]